MACTRGLGFHKKWIHVVHVVVSVNPLIVCSGLAWLAYIESVFETTMGHKSVCHYGMPITGS